MRRLTVLACLAIAVGVSLPASGLSAAGGGNLPFKGTLAGPGTLDVVTGQLHANLTGQFTHFGRSSFVEDVQLIPITPVSFDWFGTWTITAANGDRMSGTCAGSGTFTDPIHSSWSVDFVSSGGTGRFAGATLTFHSDAVATTISAQGTILTALVDAPLNGELSH